MTDAEIQKRKRSFKVVNSDVPDQQLWEEHWKDKSPAEKLDAAEEIIRGGNATSRLQRIFRVVERV